MPPVDLVVNCFERNYREVLAPGFFPAVEARNQFRFAGRIALLNNIDDLNDARRLADERLEAGEIQAWHLVSEELPDALRKTRLSRGELGRIPHYSDCALVAVTLPASPWIVYWDAEIELEKAGDWITPSIEVMDADRRILAANPSWRPDTVEAESWEARDGFALGYGFSDQVFLARREELAGPIYGARCFPSLRYPLSHIGRVFEERVDAYMRTHRRLRATYRHAHYTHAQRSTSARQWECTLRERLRRARNRLVCRALTRSPLRHPCWKI